MSLVLYRPSTPHQASPPIQIANRMLAAPALVHGKTLTKLLPQRPLPRADGAMSPAGGTTHLGNGGQAAGETNAYLWPLTPTSPLRTTSTHSPL